MKQVTKWLVVVTSTICTLGVQSSVSAEEANALAHRVHISDCGGFRLRGPGALPVPDPATYCDAERLLWAYDARTRELSLSNTRISLNCCGTHDIRVTLDADTFVVTELDSPLPYRCRCICVFDYGTTIEHVAPGKIRLRVLRHVTDRGQPERVYDGTLDLSEGKGSITIDTNPAAGCR